MTRTATSSARRIALAEPRAKRAGSRKTVTAANLESLGAERLAAILMEAGADDPALKRRLRMELAREVGGEDLAAEITKRLIAVETRRSRIHWRRYKAFVRELELLRGMIVGALADLDAKLALDLLWRFLALAEGVFRRTEDGRGEVAESFRAAAAEAGRLVQAAQPDPAALAEQVVGALETGEDDVLGGLVAAVAPVLDPAGLSALRARIDAALLARRTPSQILKAALQVVADAQGDVEAYIAAFSASEMKQPWAGAQIARRLLAAGRVEDALAALARSTPPAGARTLLSGVREWEDVFLEALEADGQVELAQELRWQAFETRLATDRLRAFLKRLPDFDDVEAEDRAMAHALAFPHFSDALRLFTEWPAAGKAAELTLARASEIEPRKAEVNEPAARLLEARHPLAASLLLRAMVADTLRWARADRFKDAERQMAELGALADQIADWGGFEGHEAFLARLAQIRRG